MHTRFILPKKALIWALYGMIFFLLANGLILYAKYWAFYFNYSELEHVYEDEKKVPHSIPYKVITEDEYLTRLKNDPNSMRLIDTREYGFDLKSKNWVFANSFYKFSSSEGLFQYIKEHRNELKNKDLIFLCHGGHRARSYQKVVADFLAKNNLQINHFAFQAGHMLREKPRWMVQKIIFLPDTLISYWEQEKILTVYEIPRSTGLTEADWDQVKKDLGRINGPVMIESGLKPGEIERQIYPLEGERFYSVHNWQTPPHWFAALIFPLGKILSYWGLLSILVLLIFFGLWKLRMGEIRNHQNSKGNKLCLARTLWGVGNYVLLFYFFNCFFFHHVQAFPYRFSFSLWNSFITLVLVYLRIVYDERKAREFLYSAINGERVQFSFRKISNLKRLFLLSFPGFLISMHLWLETAEPYHLFNYGTFIAAFVLIFYTPILDFFIFMRSRLRWGQIATGKRPIQ